jgi:hypothetical protein
MASHDFVRKGKNMLCNWRWAWVLVTAVSSGACADSLDINFHDDAARITFDGNPQPGVDYELGHFFTEKGEQTFVTHAGIHVSGENWSKEGTFEIGLGGRALYVHTKPYDAAAIALGARMRFSPVHRLGLGGSAYYAPSILSSMDGKNYREASINVDYQVLPQAFIYVGYRWINVDFQEVTDVTFDDSAHLGMKLVF